MTIDQILHGPCAQLSLIRALLLCKRPTDIDPEHDHYCGTLH